LGLLARFWLAKSLMFQPWKASSKHCFAIVRRVR
jgi:hypothetical protein